MNLIIPESVNIVGESAFSGCKNLVSVEILDKTFTISDYEFAGCPKLSYVFINDKVHRIGKQAFYGCNSLDSIVLPRSLRLIDKEAFRSCSNLKTIEFNDGLEFIGEDAFRECIKLSSITFPFTLKSIDKGAFLNCDSITNVCCYSRELPNAKNAFYSTSSAYADNFIRKSTLMVPSSSYNQYSFTKPWYEFGSIRTLPKEFFILKYIIDGKSDSEYHILEGDGIIMEPHPTKEGYTFSGWSEIPEKMPSEDIIVNGSFTINKYKVTFMYGDNELKTIEVEYGAKIPLPESLDKEGYTLIEWLDVPETMPARDIVIYASYTDGIKKVRNSENEKMRIYDLQGRRHTRMQRGVNIVRYSDETTKRVMVK